jgi:acyl-CoA thioester hydrolase
METKPFKTVILFDVKTYDIDSAGHVSNIVYIRWLEDLRLKILDNHLPLEGLVKKGIVPVLLHTDIEYKRAIHLFDKPTGTMWMSSVGNVKFSLEAEITVDGQLMARASQQGIFMSRDTEKPVRLPQEIREGFKDSE